MFSVYISYTLDNLIVSGLSQEFLLDKKFLITYFFKL